MTKTASARSNRTTSRKKSPPIVHILSGLAIVLLLPQLVKLMPAKNPLSPQLLISSGDQILIKANAPDQKEKGAQALRNKDLNLAQSQFEQSLQKFPNDPETLIYINNLRAGSNALTIAVSIPISSNLKRT